MIKNPVMFVGGGFFITLPLAIVPGLFGETDGGLRAYNPVAAVILLVTVPLPTLPSLWRRAGKALQAASLKKTAEGLPARRLTKTARSASPPAS